MFAVRGSLAAIHEYTSISSPETLRGFVTLTTTASESDTAQNCPAARGVPRRHSVSESATKLNGSLEGKMVKG